MRVVMSHISDEELELYCLGRATNEQLAPIEEHLLSCRDCVERAERMLEAIDTLREALRRMEEERQGGEK
jgi:anti-sigma factor RsiW